MKMLFLLAALLIASPAQAWRTGIGFGGGWQEEGPAATLHLDLNPGPTSHLHIQPRYLIWKPDDLPAVSEIGIDALYHFSPCYLSSVYLGYGVGAEWETGRGNPAPCAVGAPPPPKQPDPPIGVAIAGIRFLPSETVDFAVEGRYTIGQEEPRVGAFAAITFHEPREIKHPGGEYKKAPPQRYNRHDHRGYRGKGR